MTLFPGKTAPQRSGQRPLLRLTFTLSLFGFLTSGSLQAAAPAKTAPIVPKTPIILYNGKEVADLSQFYTWLGPLGYQDPNRVFTIVDHVDGAPAIRVSGETHGGILTRQQYADYKLVLEFRWGTATFGSRKNRARNSGILLHCQGEDGNYVPTFRGPWIKSVEYEILEGRMGDIILVRGHVPGSDKVDLPRITIPVINDKPTWNPKGTPKEYTSGQTHLHWEHFDPNWKDELGQRDLKGLEKPTGEWNRAEAIMDGDRLTYYFNGVKVMTGTNGTLKHGKLMFQSEGAEIFFRRIELLPLTSADRAK